VLPRRVLLFCCLQALAIHLVLFCVWPLVHSGYARLFRFGTRVTAASVGAVAGFTTDVVPGLERLDTEIRVSRPGSGPVGILRIDSRFTGYLPLSLMLALALATPARWRVRLVLAAGGVVAIAMFAAVRVAMSVLLVAQEVGAIMLAPFPQRILTRVEGVLGHAASSAYLIPLVIWIALLAGCGGRRVLRSRDTV